MTRKLVIINCQNFKCVNNIKHELAKKWINHMGFLGYLIIVTLNQVFE